MSGTEAESDRRQREQQEICTLKKAKPPNLTLAGREHIASAADNVRLPAKRVATGPQQADHSSTGPENLLVWTAPDGIERARLRSLLISDKGTVRGTD